MQLARPLTQEQIYAAQKFWDEQKLTSQRVLTLKQLSPRPEVAVVLKIDALDKDYYTHIKARTEAVSIRLAAWAVKATATGPDLVEELVNEIEQDTMERNYVFASKYVSLFFPDSNLPIMDSRAEMMVNSHLGSPEWTGLEEYHVFYQRITKLRQKANLTCDWVELDKYLWIAGSFWAHVSGEKVNTGLSGRFDNYLKNGPQSDPTLTTLLGKA
jgi:hypothetical protein